MATSREFMDFVADRLAFAGNVRYKKMFGEYMVYIDEKPLVLVCDETPFVKMAPCLDGLMTGAERGFPYSGAKEHYILNIENSELTMRVIDELAKVTSVPKPRAKKPPKSKTEHVAVIDEYINNQSPNIQKILLDVCQVIREALPNATERISYKMPTFWQGCNLIHFAAQKNHLGIYPGAAAMEHFAPRLKAYKSSKGAVQFPYETIGSEQLAIISEIAKWCGKEYAKE